MKNEWTFLMIYTFHLALQLDLYLNADQSPFAKFGSMTYLCLWYNRIFISVLKADVSSFTQTDKYTCLSGIYYALNMYLVSVEYTVYTVLDLISVFRWDCLACLEWWETLLI